MTATRRLIMQKARSHSKELLPLVDVRFQVLFTRLLAVLFTFPSRYYCAIGLRRVFSLGGWCRRIQRGFLRSPPTQDTDCKYAPSCKGLSPSTAVLPRTFHSVCIYVMSVLQPRVSRNLSGLGYSAFARHYLRNHCLFSSPGGT